MRVKRLVEQEWEVCEACGYDFLVGHDTLRACGACGKGVCRGCTASYAVEVRRNGKVVYGKYSYPGCSPSRSSSSEPTPILGAGHAGYYATYCAACGGGIEAGLVACGFVPHPTDKPPAAPTPDS